MRRWRWNELLLTFFLLLAMISIAETGLVARAAEAPQPQPTPFLTPTAGQDGKIIYIIQPLDTFYDIAAIAGITLEELYALNGIQDTDFAIPGTELLLGYSGPAEPTVDQNTFATQTAVIPTSTPLFSTGEICVLLFLDINGNAQVEDGEESLAEGQVSIVDTAGTVAVEATTSDEPGFQCFKDIEAGDYNVSAAVPAEYNPTTSMNLPLRLLPGDIKYVQFGAQASAALGNNQQDLGRGQSLLFGIFGMILLIVAGVLGYYASRYQRRNPLR